MSGSLRVGVAAGAAGAVSALVPACRKSSPTSGPPTPLSGRIEILIAFDGGNDARQRQVQQSLAGAFIAAHPQVSVDFLRATSRGAASSELLALLQRGSPPDIVLGIDLADVSRLIDRHLWLDLHPLISRDRVDAGAFLPEAWSAATVPGYYRSTRGIAGLPLGVHDHALAYNAELLSRAGVAAPPESWSGGDGWTYAGAFLDAAQRLTLDAGGRHAAQVGFDRSQIVQFGTARIPPESIVFGFADGIYDRAHRRATLTASAVISGAQFAGDLVQRYSVQPTDEQLRGLAAAASAGAPAGPGAADPVLDAWRAGKLAMIALCSCELASGYALNVPFNWRVAALPAGPARRFRPLHVSLASIVAASHRHDVAWEVLKFFALNAGNQRLLAYQGFGTVPALSANVDAFSQGVQRNAHVDPSVWIAGLSGASSDADTWVPAFDAVHGALDAGLAAIAAGAPAATVMRGVQSRAQAQIDAWFKANKLP